MALMKCAGTSRTGLARIHMVMDLLTLLIKVHTCLKTWLRLLVLWPVSVLRRKVESAFALAGCSRHQYTGYYCHVVIYHISSLLWFCPYVPSSHKQLLSESHGNVRVGYGLWIKCLQWIELPLLVRLSSCNKRLTVCQRFLFSNKYFSPNKVLWAGKKIEGLQKIKSFFGGGLYCIPIPPLRNFPIAFMYNLDRFCYWYRPFRGFNK